MFNENPDDETIRRMLGLRLKALRLDKKLTRKDVGTSTGISPKTLGSYERGESYPSLNRAHSLCKIFDAPLDFLFDGAGLNRTLNTKLGTMVQRRR